MKQLHSSFTNTMLVDGKAKNIEIAIYTEHDDSEIDVEFTDDAEKLEFMRKLETSVIMHVLVIVEAKLGNIVGNCMMGGCFVSDFGDVNTIVSDYGMIAQAKEALESNIEETLTLLT